MKTVQVVLEEELLRSADSAASKDKINRSELFRRALREHLQRRRRAELEAADRRGYERFPVKPGEFDVWDRVTAWPED